jgi:hypothetical protein
MGDRQHTSRAGLTRRARALARSGSHPNWESIEAELRAAGELPPGRTWLQDPGFQHQLTALCAVARQTRNADQTEEASTLSSDEHSRHRQASWPAADW